MVIVTAFVQGISRTSYTNDHFLSRFPSVEVCTIVFEQPEKNVGSTLDFLQLVLTTHVYGSPSFINKKPIFMAFIYLKKHQNYLVMPKSK